MSQSNLIQTESLRMLAQGISPVQVAATLGVDPSYISQLMADEDFRSALELQKVERVQEDLDHDKKLDKAEGEYLDRITEKSKFANLQQSMQAFKILNGARRRRDTSVANASIQIGAIVNIHLPASAAPQYVVNAKNEIVEVEGKTMVSATPRRLDEILAIRNGNTEQQKRAQLPGVTRVERAAVAIEKLDNKPIKRLTRNTAPEDLVDLI
jgi:transcriptional regulator with XRE-family HTH domain